MNSKKGFTLLELLVVVLIIGILASIALPQYQIAVTKSRVASILPLMRRWKDAYSEYKLQHGSYYKNAESYTPPAADDLGVNWPDDWRCDNRRMVECENDYWYCFPNEEGSSGYVYCQHDIDSNNMFRIFMFQVDESIYEGVAGMMVCEASGTEGNKVCRALGGELLNGVHIWADNAYRLN